jgi:hypothetical protein
MPAAAPRGMKKCPGLEASAGYIVGECDRLILKEASHSLETGAAGAIFRTAGGAISFLSRFVASPPVPQYRPSPPKLGTPPR